jgi:hypothetical protein
VILIGGCIGCTRSWVACDELLLVERYFGRLALAFHPKDACQKSLSKVQTIGVHSSQNLKFRRQKTFQAAIMN